MMILLMVFCAYVTILSKTWVCRRVLQEEQHHGGRKNLHRKANNNHRTTVFTILVHIVYVTEMWVCRRAMREDQQHVWGSPQAVQDTNSKKRTQCSILTWDVCVVSTIVIPGYGGEFCETKSIKHSLNRTACILFTILRCGCAGEPCEKNSSTCGGRNEMCIARGPAYEADDYGYASNLIIASRQSEKAKELWASDSSLRLKGT
jgi:hypothetical protein